MRSLAYFTTVLLAVPVVWAGDGETNEERPIEIGVRGAGMFGPGDPTNDMLGAGVFGRVRMAPGWAVGIGLDQLNYDVETPIGAVGLEAPDADAAGKSNALSGWIERNGLISRRLEWFAAGGASYVSVDVGPLSGTTDAGQPYMLTNDISNERRFGDWQFKETVSGREGSLDDYGATGLWLGISYRFRWEPAEVRRFGSVQRPLGIVAGRRLLPRSVRAGSGPSASRTRSGTRSSSPVKRMLHSRDRHLAQRVLRKERAAFDEFFESYFSRLFRFCASRMRNRGGQNDVEDLVQETMVKALRNLEGYRGEASLFTWLCQICRHEIASWHRRHARWPETVASIDDDPAVRAAIESLDVEVSEELDRRASISELVQLALDRLPGDYASALEQKYLAGSSVQEIAGRLGRSVIATQSLLARARTAFMRSYVDLQRELGANT